MNDPGSAEHIGNDDYNSMVPNNHGIIDGQGHRVINGMVQPARRRFQVPQAQGSQVDNLRRMTEQIQMERQETGFDSSQYGNDTLRYQQNQGPMSQ